MNINNERKDHDETDETKIIEIRPWTGFLTACLAVSVLAGAGGLTAHAEVKLPTYKR